VVEPDRFNEPGLYIVRPDGTLYWGATSTMPFGRPHFARADYVQMTQAFVSGEAMQAA